MNVHHVTHSQSVEGIVRDKGRPLEGGVRGGMTRAIKRGRGMKDRGTERSRGTGTSITNRSEKRKQVQRNGTPQNVTGHSNIIT
jgi:hypothetical protein